jgi:RHS repeat-associated protein
MYDPFDELISVTNGAGQTVSYTYTPNRQVAAITYPLPSTATWATTSTVNFTYDNADYLSNVTDFNGNKITIGRTADGLPSTVGLGSTGDTINVTYDGTDMPSAISVSNATSTLQSFTYSDSPSGTILSETDTPASSASPATYTYDADSRVTSMTPGTGATANYSYEASGSLTTLPTGGTGTYDNAGELTSSAVNGTTTSYTYDKDGERLSETSGGSTVASGTWNGAGQLTSYTDQAGSTTAATYNGDGQREADTSGTTTQDFTWDTVSPVPQLLTDSTNAYIYAGGTAPAEQVNLATGAITYLVTDSLGSVRGTINSSGALTGTTSYDTWGNPATTGGLTASTPFGYAGGYTDLTGLIYLLDRYYDPQVGQFISVDPALPQTLQPYAYAYDNPVTNTDPEGEMSCRGVPTWSEYRTCWIYLNERRVHTIEWYLVVGAGAATICWAVSGGILTPVCGVAAGLLGIALGYVYRDDYGKGEYLDVYQARWTWEYPYGITWWGSILWRWGHTPWWDYWLFLSPA